VIALKKGTKGNENEGNANGGKSSGNASLMELPQGRAGETVKGSSGKGTGTYFTC